MSSSSAWKGKLHPFSSVLSIRWSVSIWRPSAFFTHSSATLKLCLRFLEITHSGHPKHKRQSRSTNTLTTNKITKSQSSRYKISLCIKDVKTKLIWKEMTAGFRLAECRHSRVETPSHDRTSQFARDSNSVVLYKLCCSAKLKRTRLLIKLANSFLCLS